MGIPSRPTGVGNVMPVPRGGGDALEKGEGVVLFGGTFDPPTRAHIEVGMGAREAVAERCGNRGSAWLIFVPAARSPFKSAAMAGARDRVAMLELATQGHERVGVWTEEIDRAAARLDTKNSSTKVSAREGTPSYWVETVQQARRVLPTETRLWFVLGADQAEKFHKWHQARTILALAQPIVVLREPVGSLEALDEAMRASGFWTAEELKAWHEAVVDLPMQAGSATQVREALGTPGNEQVLEALLDPKVLSYIREHGVYRG